MGELMKAYVERRVNEGVDEDVAIAEWALQDNSPSIPWEQVKEELKQQFPTDSNGRLLGGRHRIVSLITYLTEESDNVD